MMTQPWTDIAQSYRDVGRTDPSIVALEKLSGQIDASMLHTGLFGWTSMLDLCIVQREVSHPYYGPMLRLSPVTSNQIEFRYLDVHESAKQWHRTVDHVDAFARLLKTLDQLRWFSPQVIACREESCSCGDGSHSMGQEPGVMVSDG